MKGYLWEGRSGGPCEWAYEKGPAKDASQALLKAVPIGWITLAMAMAMAMRSGAIR